MEIAKADLLEVLQSIFRCVLHWEVEPDDAATEPSASGRWTAAVHIAGAWNGTIILETGSPLARAAAAEMFDVAPSAVGDQDIQDSLAELANMIGGNVKTVLPGPSFLSLPTVTEGLDYSVAFPKACPVASLGLTSQGERLRVVLLRERREDELSPRQHGAVLSAAGSLN